MSADLEAVIEQAFTDAGPIYDSDGPKARILAAVAEAVAAERERIAQIAEQHHAHYDCDPAYGEPFADLLRRA